MNQLKFLFSPKNVAVVGASTDPTKLGGRPIRFLKEFGFTGGIFPINARNAVVQGLPAFPSVLDVPDNIDQAILVVPSNAVEAALAECIQKGIPVVQILSSGFAEAGDAGRAAQDRLVAMAQRSGTRITGPNALGSVSPRDCFFGTFSTALSGMKPRPGNIAVATQSGAFGSCTYVMASQRGLGLSRIIATGNEADVDVADSISFFADDDQTEVICAAIESCQDGGKLRRALTKAAANRKPVVIMKVGRTDVGAAAAATHTGALAGDDLIFDTVFKECGAYRAASIEEMIDVAYVLSTSKPPDNSKVSVLSVSGGIGILLADAATELDLELAGLPVNALEQVRKIIPFAIGDNPLDTTAQVSAHPGAFRKLSEIILRENVFGTLLLYLANNALSPQVFAAMHSDLISLKRQFPDSVIVTVMPSHPEVRASLESAGVLVFEDPSRAIRAIAGASSFQRRWVSVDYIDRPAIPKESVKIARPLHEAAAKELLSGAGLPVLPEMTVRTAKQAAAAGSELGFPVVLKILSPDILHKTEVGGVALNLADETAVTVAFAEIEASVAMKAPHALVEGMIVAPMVSEGLQLVLAMHRDPIFGPMIALGLGGVFVELMKDVAFASIPVDRVGAQRMIAAARWNSLLDGWRGSAPLDQVALEEAIVALSRLVESTGSKIIAVEMNPILLRTDGCLVLDALVNIIDAEER